MSTTHLGKTESGSATPIARQHDNHVAVQELSNQLTHLVATLKSSASAQQKNISQLSTTDVNQNIERLHFAVGKQKQKEQETLHDTKNWVRQDLRGQILSQLRDTMQDEIRKEIARTVKEQVDAQIVNHITVPLDEQLADCKTQLKYVEVSLTNSTARGIHAYYELAPDSLQEPLKAFVDKFGRKSDVYPADLYSLFTYDSESLRKLVTDYGLPADNERHVNINRFMDHIGIKRRLETINIGNPA